MTIRELLNGIEYRTDIDLDAEIADITADSRKVAEGSVFVCVSGTRVDAHVFAADARKAGAAAVIGERDTGDGSVNVFVESCRSAYAIACSNFFALARDAVFDVSSFSTSAHSMGFTSVRIFSRACRMRSSRPS